jgi:hypothetical protein
MQIRSLWLASLMLALAGGSAGAGDLRTTIELTGAYTTPSSAKDSTWGWWDPAKYDDWETIETSEFHLADARLLFSGTTYSIIAGGEWYPDLEATASRTDGDTGNEIHDDLTASFRAYDLAIAQFYGRADRTGWMPWFGATMMEIDETRSSMDSATDRADSRLWGVVVGADVGGRVVPRLLVSGRVVARWGRGSRDATIAAPEPAAADPTTTSVDLSDSVDQFMWGVDLGLRWAAVETLHLEGGWRYRDWSYDGGPASFNGPYVRLVWTL